MLAKAKFAVDGTAHYPDATFTLRLSFGKVKGYSEDGKKVPVDDDDRRACTRARRRPRNKAPFELPKRWVEQEGKLNCKTPFNFVSTADIIGGNSGSPVINARGEVVGLIFDGNIQSLVRRLRLRRGAGPRRQRTLGGAHRGAAQGLRRGPAGGRIAGTAGQKTRLALEWNPGRDRLD